MLCLPFPQGELAYAVAAVEPGPDATGTALWPAGLALAWAVARQELALPATGAALDLGCGGGIVALALACWSTLEVTAADRVSAARAAACANAAGNRLDGRIAVADLDWERPPPRCWDAILVADGLYRPEAGAALARFCAAALAPGGVAWIADPGRHSARHFGWQAREVGLAVEPGELAVPFTDVHGPVAAVQPALAPGPLRVQVWRCAPARD